MLSQRECIELVLGWSTKTLPHNESLHVAARLAPMISTNYSFTTTLSCSHTIPLVISQIFQAVLLPRGITVFSA